MRRVQLISEKTLKELSLINENVEGNYLQPCIMDAQEINLQQLIGTSLYHRLCDLVSSGDIYNEEYAAYKDLLDEYVSVYLAYCVMADIQIPLAYKMVNKGIVQTNDTNILNSQLRDIQFMKDYYREKADFYGTRLLVRVVHNTSLFPEFGKENCCELKPSNSFDCNILL